MPKAKKAAEATIGSPRASRPHVPGYGFPTSAKGMMEWSAVEARLTKAMNFWVCTAGKNGVPHARPVWAVWVDGALCFGGHGVRWEKNLAENPAVSVHLESGDDVVILEGEVQRITDMSLPFVKRSEEVAKKKYGMGGEGPFWALRPRRAFAWTLKTRFRDATRWHFTPQKIG